MKESDIQKDIIKYFEMFNFLVVKIIQTNKNGWPDLQVHKDGTTIFIEVKSDKGKISELQKYRHEQLRQQGFVVIITSSINDLNNELIRISTELQKEFLFDNCN
jgi:hypothetical protein